MKSPSVPTPSVGDASDPNAQRHGRRRLVVGAGVAAGAAVAAAALQRNNGPQAPVVEAKDAPAAAEGYRLTDHVRRYYETART